MSHNCFPINKYDITTSTTALQTPDMGQAHQNVDYHV